MDHHEIEQIWAVLLWSGGFILTAFGILFAQVWNKASYRWIEETFSKDMKKEISLLNETLMQIKNALIGDLINPGGMVNDISNIKKEMNNIKENCKRCHDNGE